MSVRESHQKLDLSEGSFFKEFRLVDPQSRKDFDPNLYPRAIETTLLASELADRNKRITLEFRAVYYELNRLHARLIEIRGQAGSAAQTLRERALMQEIEKYLRIRDELEDRYAPYGVIAEAITQDGFTVDIKFVFGDRDAARQRQMQFFSSSALLIFPKPESVDPEHERPKS